MPLTDQDLEYAATVLGGWRAQGPPGRRIPEALWKEVILPLLDDEQRTPNRVGKRLNIRPKLIRQRYEQCNGHLVPSDVLKKEQLFKVARERLNVANEILVERQGSMQEEFPLAEIGKPLLKESYSPFYQLLQGSDLPEPREEPEYPNEPRPLESRDPLAYDIAELVGEQLSEHASQAMDIAGATADRLTFTLVESLTKELTKALRPVINDLLMQQQHALVQYLDRIATHCQELAEIFKDHLANEPQAEAEKAGSIDIALMGDSGAQLKINATSGAHQAYQLVREFMARENLHRVPRET